MVQSLLKLPKLDWAVPDFITVSRRQRHLRVQLSYRPSQSPLLPELIGQIPAAEPVASVSADGGHDTRACQSGVGL